MRLREDANNPEGGYERDIGSPRCWTVETTAVRARDDLSTKLKFKLKDNTLKDVAIRTVFPAAHSLESAAEEQSTHVPP